MGDELSPEDRYWIYANELMSETIYYFSRLLINREHRKKGQLIITLHHLIAALEERPFDTKVLNYDHSGNKQADTRNNSEAPSQRSATDIQRAGCLSD